ncbi:MAG TPA: hypothetical protein VFI25_01320 [Planctomycetota bacterium]|nr:hypothetical protein [Planctomycetota bacterium]
MTGPARAHRCDRCGAQMVEHHCKIVCPRCGFMRDCSDPRAPRRRLPLPSGGGGRA